jgi:hypothetical protein
MSEIRPSRVLLFSVAVALLCGGAAFLVYSRILPDPGPGALPSTGDALLRVPVWVGDDGDLRVLLRPLYQREEADLANDRLLARDLFPAAPGTRFAVLWVFHYGKEGEVVLDRTDEAIRLEDEEGRSVALPDLPAALRGANLPPDLGLGLRVYEAHRASVTVAAGSYCRVLVALPEGVEADTLRGATILGVPLLRRRVVRYRLDNFLSSPRNRGELLLGAL